jgi:transcriptional regulator with XRE-family HTH domain
MRSESEVCQALLRRKGLSVTDLASKLGVTRQHAHRLLTGRRPAESQREELEQALALGRPAGGSPLFAVGELDDNGELDLVPAGDAQPLFADRDPAGDVARALEPASLHVCVVPVWPEYAWRNLVAFHAAWGAQPEPRKLFIVDNGMEDLPLDTLVSEIRAGLDATLQSRAQAHDPAYLSEVESHLQRLN